VANRGRLRHPTVTTSPSPPVNVHPSQFIPRTVQSKITVSSDGEDDVQTFGVDFDGDELSATVLCCDYPECRSMGALQKDYLRDHYMTYHDECLIKPSVMIPPAASMMNSRSLRCSACLRKLTDENQGSTCDNCQRFEPIRNAAVMTLPDYMNGLEGIALGFTIGVHVLNQAVLTDVSTSPLKPWPEDVDSRQSAVTNGEPSRSSLKEEAEENPPSQPSFWTPPEIPEHW
jgi:uncharacterized CHY-type Zn-finger protein